MDNNVKTWLFDIINSIIEIDLYIGQPRLFEHYQNDMRIKPSVERNFEIIGEAMNRILKENSAIEISNSRKIAAVRNRIIHG
jgi:uncharacterized protein with HEPN domain